MRSKFVQSLYYISASTIGLGGLLLALAIGLVVASYYFFQQHQKQQKIRKSQLDKLAQLKQQNVNFIALNQLLKGCALGYFPRCEVASLHGEQWFDFSKIQWLYYFQKQTSVYAAFISKQ